MSYNSITRKYDSAFLLPGGKILAANSDLFVVETGVYRIDYGSGEYKQALWMSACSA